MGITGGIGSGKSTVARVFAALDVPIYAADKAARCCMQQDAGLRAAISAYFGAAAYTAGALNSRYLAQQVFQNPQKRQWLNKLVHPAVRAAFRNWLEQQSSLYVLYEAALLFEEGVYKELNRTLLVVAPRSLRLQRVLARDPQRSAAEVRQIMRTQMPERQALALTDSEHTLRNNERSLLIPQILRIHQKIIA